MLNSNNRNDILDKFISGELDGEELENFLYSCKENPELRKCLDKISGIEALFHDSADSHVADIRFENLVNKAVGIQHNRIKESLFLRVYAVAATILLLIIGGYNYKSLFSSEKPNNTLTVEQSKPLHIPEKSKSITRFTKNAILVAEEGTRARVIENSDSIINLVVAQGNAYFDVSPDKNVRVNLVTPHSSITLHGTVFRIVVTELETEITVLEGTVQVAHRNDLDSPMTLSNGGTGIADLHALHLTETLTPEMCMLRKSMLRTYIGWVQKQMNG